jgi:hypothetical protein
MNEDVFNASIRKFLKANKVASLGEIGRPGGSDVREKTCG